MIKGILIFTALLLLYIIIDICIFRIFTNKEQPLKNVLHAFLTFDNEFLKKNCKCSVAAFCITVIEYPMFFYVWEML